MIAQQPTIGHSKSLPSQDVEQMQNLIEAKTADLDEIAIKGDRLVVNNFSIREWVRDRDDMPEDKALILLEFSCSIKNKSDQPRRVSIIVVGFDEKKSPLWAAHLRGGLRAISAHSTATLNEYDIVVPVGTKDNTAIVRISAFGDF